MWGSRTIRLTQTLSAKKQFFASFLRTEPLLLHLQHNGPNSVVRCSVAFITREFSHKIDISDEVCPQGIQGDDCENFKLWLENCRRHGLSNCDEQLQGIQTGRKTLAEVLKEQEDLIAAISAQYKERMMDRSDSAQGVQEAMTAFPTIDSPCPQGVQGDECARFKLWLENCHRFGIQDCMHQYTSFKAGRKTLAQIFEEQENIIRAVVSATRIQRRNYSTSTNPGTPKSGFAATESSVKSEAGVKEAANSDTQIDEPVVAEGQLSHRQKLQRAVKEYGSTVIVFHVTISLMSLGFFYVLVTSGIDVVGLLQSAGIGGTIIQNKLAAGTGTFVVAYAVHKVFAPVRIATTLTATPFIVRYLRRIGFLKVPKTKST